MSELPQAVKETVSPAGLRERAKIQRDILDEGCARHLELAADEIERLRASSDAPQRMWDEEWLRETIAIAMLTRLKRAAQSTRDPVTQRDLQEIIAALRAAGAGVGMPSDDFINAFLKAEGSFVEAYEAPRESGVAIDMDMSQDDADAFNAEARNNFKAAWKAASQVTRPVSGGDE